MLANVSGNLLWHFSYYYFFQNFSNILSELSMVETWPCQHRLLRYFELFDCLMKWIPCPFFSATSISASFSACLSSLSLFLESTASALVFGVSGFLSHQKSPFSCRLRRIGSMQPIKQKSSKYFNNILTVWWLARKWMRPLTKPDATFPYILALCPIALCYRMPFGAASRFRAAHSSSFETGYCRIGKTRNPNKEILLCECYWMRERKKSCNHRAHAIMPSIRPFRC